MRFGPADADLAVLGDRHLDAGERTPAAPPLVGREVGVEAVPAIRAEGLGHPEEVRPGARGRSSLGWQDGAKAGVAQRREVGGGEGRVGRQLGGLVRPAPEQGHPLPLEEPEGAVGVRLGLGQEGGPRQQRRDQPAAEPPGPEERHGDVEALAGADAAGLEPGGRGPQAAAVGVDRALGAARAARGEQHDEVVRAAAPGPPWRGPRPAGRLGRGALRERSTPAAGPAQPDGGRPIRRPRAGPEPPPPGRRGRTGRGRSGR